MSEAGASPAAFFVMGICGSGKSTVAAGLAAELGIQMLDADDFHPPENVEKMRAGEPLTDADRSGWLERLNDELRDRQAAGESVVLACSALKQRYRDRLEQGVAGGFWIYLKGDRATIEARMGRRQDHFMPASLVTSQLAALEEPEGALELDIRKPAAALVAEAALAARAAREESV